MAEDDATGTMAGEPSRAASRSVAKPGLVLAYAPEPVPAVVPLARGSTVIGRERGRAGSVAYDYLQQTIGLAFFRSIRP